LVKLARITAADVNVAAGGQDSYQAGMSEQDVARFRAQMDECLQQAERAIRTLDREAWLRMAEEWNRMTQEADRRLRK
jgi:hypothetical protein